MTPNSRYALASIDRVWVVGYACGVNPKKCCLMRCVLSLCCLLLPTCSLIAEPKNASFNEVWAYVYHGEEKNLRSDMPITDVGHFSVVVNDVGRITTSMDPSKVRGKAPPGTRVHCVVSAPFNKSLMYWCLRKDSETRDSLLEDVIFVSTDYDGVQIDFESIRPEEAEAYTAFLQDLRRRLPKRKLLSVALPARVKEMHDGYPYKAIGEIVDRVLIMAYDEHWSSGSPGEIASTAWCQKVGAFAQQQIPSDKLVMGIPLYGRVWQPKRIARALKYPETLELWKQVHSTVKRKRDGTPHFSFEETVEGVVYYEDMISLDSKLDAYKTMGIQSVGFWRLGQGPAALWKHISFAAPE